MQNKTSNKSVFNMSETIKTEDKDMNCKDGYCFLPNLEENKTISNENKNIFDPLQISFINKMICLSGSIDHFKPK